MLNENPIHIDLDNFEVYSILGSSEKPIPTFDIYETAVPTALDFLQKFNTKAIFFVVGIDLIRSKRCVPILEQVIQEGHVIANHTMNHRNDFHSTSQEIREEEIKNCHEIVRKYLRYEMKIYRAPGYSFSLDALDCLDKLGYDIDFSRTSLIYTSLLDTYFKRRLQNKKTFPNFRSKSGTLAKNLLMNSQRGVKVARPLRITNISSVWFKEISLTRGRVSSMAMFSSEPILLHAVDFLDFHDKKCKVPALTIPFEERFAVLQKIFSNL